MPETFPLKRPFFFCSVYVPLILTSVNSIAITKHAKHTLSCVAFCVTFANENVSRKWNFLTARMCSNSKQRQTCFVEALSGRKSIAIHLWICKFFFSLFFFLFSDESKRLRCDWVLCDINPMCENIVRPFTILSTVRHLSICERLNGSRWPARSSRFWCAEWMMNESNKKAKVSRITTSTIENVNPEMASK